MKEPKKTMKKPKATATLFFTDGSKRKEKATSIAKHKGNFLVKFFFGAKGETKYITESLVDVEFLGEKFEKKRIARDQNGKTPVKFDHVCYFEILVRHNK